MAGFPNTGIELKSELLAKAWAKKLVLEHKNDTLFTALTGVVDNSKNMAVPGVVVEKNEEIADGRTDLTVPFLNKLTNGPIIGDQDALGLEEKQKVRFVKVDFDDVQQAVSIKNKGRVAHQNKFYSFMSYVYPQLRDWWNEWLECEHFRGFVDGQSFNITSPDSAVGAAATLHPLQYTANAGKITTVTPAGVQTAIDALDAANTTMSIQQLDRMSLAAKQSKIMPFKTRYGYFYAVFLHENAIYDLRTGNSAEWNNLMKDAEPRNYDKNRSITNYLGTYRDLMLFEATRSPTIGTDTGGGTITNFFADVDTERPQATGDSVAVTNILSGQGSLCSVVAAEINFDEEFYSYRFTKGVGSHKLYGYRRPDWTKETGGSADNLPTVYNQSSLLWYTDSVSPI